MNIQTYLLIEHTMKNKTSKKKEEVKTAQAYDTDEVIIYRGCVKCPHCEHENSVERCDFPPTITQCYNCLEQFNIEWE